MLKAGDTVIFKGGVSYLGEITVNGSGSADNPIIYDGNTSETWGTGKAVLDGGDKHVYGSRGFTIMSKQYVTVKGFIIQNYSGAFSGGIRMEQSNFILIQDCKVWEIGDWNLAHCGGESGVACDNTYLNGGAGEGTGIAIDKCSDILIEDVEITKATKIGISLKGAGNNLEVRNCYIHDYQIFAMDVAPCINEVMTNVFIHDNVIANTYHYANKFWYSIDGKARPGEGANPHTNGIFVRNPNSYRGLMRNIQIYNNSFYDEANFTDMEAGGTAQLYFSEFGRFNGSEDEAFVYNNLFQGCYPYYSVSISPTYYGAIHMYNNTFNMQRSTAIRFVRSQTDGTRLFLKNNIFNMADGAALTVKNDNTAKGVTADYNLFKSDYIVSMATPYHQYKTLEAWRSSPYGQDTHSIQTPDAGLVDPQDILHASLSNLRLRADSPAINKGIDIGQDFPFLKYDKDGNLRGADGAWDIGAYEYVPTGPYLAVIAPRANTIWRLGTSHNITWAHNELTGNLKIDWHKSGTSQTIAQNVSIEDGSSPWQIPVNLTLGSDYTIKISSGTSEADSGIFSILAQVAPMAQTDIAASITANSAVLRGTVNAHGLGATYYFEYGTTNTYGSVTPETNAGSGENNVSVSAPISGLTADTIYHYRIVADNGVGSPTPGTDATFKTSPSGGGGGWRRFRRWRRRGWLFHRHDSEFKLLVYGFWFCRGLAGLDE